MTLKEAELLSLKILKDVMEEKLSPANVQLATVTSAKGFHILPEAELTALVDEL